MSADEVIQAMADAKPHLRNGADALIAFLHIVMKQKGFRCVGIGEQGDIKEEKDMFPEGWNSLSDSYSFRYKHSQSSMTFLFKCLVMGSTLLIHAIALEDDKIHSINTTIKENIREGVAMTEYYDLFTAKIRDLFGNFNVDIIAKLFPNLKEGFEDRNATNPTQNNNNNAANNANNNNNVYINTNPHRPAGYDPLRIEPVRPRPPPLGQGDYGIPVPFAGGYGDADRFPALGGMGVPGLPSGGGFMPPGIGGGRGGGSLMGPHDFRVWPGTGMPPGALPPGVHPPPPGARFDPFSPIPPSNVNRPPRTLPGGDPDPDHLPPPGYSDMY